MPNEISPRALLPGQFIVAKSSGFPEVIRSVSVVVTLGNGMTEEYKDNETVAPIDPPVVPPEVIQAIKDAANPPAEEEIDNLAALAAINKEEAINAG